MKILVADDDRDITRAVQVRLGHAGFDVVRAHDGHEAVARTRETLPDLIILDISMPGGDGFSVFEQLKAAPDTREIPVLFLTAHGSIPNWLTAMGAGASDFIGKPYDGVKLVCTVRETLARWYGQPVG